MPLTVDSAPIHSTQSAAPTPAASAATAPIRAGRPDTARTLADPIPLAQALIRRPSVTPVEEGALDVAESALAALGFTPEGKGGAEQVYGVPPEDLPKFYRALASHKGEFINGVRLVYPMEARAMRFANLVGNKFFSLAFSWLLGQSIKDTLCGTKVLWRADYERLAANRSYFGDFDPFGDFNLLFGSALLDLRIRDLPVFEDPVELRVIRLRLACPRCGPRLEHLDWLEPHARVTRRLARSVARFCTVASVRHAATAVPRVMVTAPKLGRARIAPGRSRRRNIGPRSSTAEGNQRFHPGSLPGGMRGSSMRSPKRSFTCAR